MYRSLAEANPDANLPEPGFVCYKFSSRLGELGRREEALAPAQEAVEHVPVAGRG